MGKFFIKRDIIILSEIILIVESVDFVELYGENNKKLNLFWEVFFFVIIIFCGSSVKMVGDKKDM